MNAPQNSRIRGVLVLLLVLALGAGGYVWFQDNYEKKPFTVPLRNKKASRDQHRTPWLVKYLQASGYRVEEREGMRFFSALPQRGESGDILLLWALPALHSRGVYDALHAWASQGGHLIVAQQASTEAADDFLQQVGATTVSTEAADKKLGDGGRTCLHTKAGGQKLKIDLGYSVPNLACLPGHTAEWQVTGELEQVQAAQSAEKGKKGKNDKSDKSDKKNFPKNRAEQVAQALARGAETKRLPAPGNLIQRHRVGKGTITLLTDRTIFSRSMLPKADNAFLLSTTMGNLHPAQGLAPTVWVWRAGDDSLIRQVVTGSPRLLSGILLCLLLLLWNRQARLRPPERLPIEARRDVLEYFTGWGRFAWQINRAKSLLAGNRENLAQTCRARLGGKAGLEQAESGESNESNESNAKGQNDSNAVQKVALEHPAHTEADLERISRAMFRLEQRLKRTNRAKTTSK